MEPPPLEGPIEPDLLPPPEPPLLLGRWAETLSTLKVAIIAAAAKTTNPLFNNLFIILCLIRLSI
jgi:hypothetical protein